MGQKANPLVLRNKFYPVLWSHSFIDSFNLRKLLLEYFSKKGFYVNNLNIYLLDAELFLFITVLTSRKSSIFHRRFRRFLSKKRFIYKSKNQDYIEKKYAKSVLRGVYFFLDVLSNHYSLKNIYLKFKRLDRGLHSRCLSSLWNGMKKYSSFSYRRAPYVIDLLLVSSYVLRGDGSAFLINQVLVAMFNRMAKRSHRRFLLFLKSFFTTLCSVDKYYKNCLHGIKLLVSGKVGGKTRSKMFEFSVGRVPTQSVSVIIDYSCITSFTLLGTFGFKVWIAFKKYNFLLNPFRPYANRSFRSIHLFKRFSKSPEKNKRVFFHKSRRALKVSEKFLKVKKSTNLKHAFT